MAPLPGSVRPPPFSFPPFSLRMCAFAAEEGGEKEVLDKLPPPPPDRANTSFLILQPLLYVIERSFAAEEIIMTCPLHIKKM